MAKSYIKILKIVSSEHAKRYAGIRKKNKNKSITQYPIFIQLCISYEKAGQFYNQKDQFQIIFSWRKISIMQGLLGL